MSVMLLDSMSCFGEKDLPASQLLGSRSTLYLWLMTCLNLLLETLGEVLSWQVSKMECVLLGEVYSSRWSWSLIGMLKHLVSGLYFVF